MTKIINIIEFTKTLGNNNISEEQIYESIKYIYNNSHDFKQQVNNFYCDILKHDYFNEVDTLQLIYHGGEEQLKKLAHDIYQYCLNNIK